MKLYNKTTGQMIVQDVLEANNVFSRGRGLLGRKSFENTKAMWFVPGNNIHTWFMQFPIDVIFVDKKLVVKKLVYDLRPFRIVWPVWGAYSFFELNGGALQQVQISPGDELYVGA